MKPIITDKGLWVDTRACRDESEEPCMFAVIVTDTGELKVYDLLRRDKDAEHPVVNLEEMGWQYGFKYGLDREE